MVNTSLKEESQPKRELERRSEIKLAQKKNIDLGNSFAQNMPIKCLEPLKELVEWRRFELPTSEFLY